MGEAYDLSIDYKSTTPVSMSVYRQTASGWDYWRELVFSPARATWGKAIARTPLIPEGTARLSFGLSISTNGTLLTDNYAIAKVAAPLPLTRRRPGEHHRGPLDGPEAPRCPTGICTPRCYATARS